MLKKQNFAIWAFINKNIRKEFYNLTVGQHYQNLKIADTFQKCGNCRSEHNAKIFFEIGQAVSKLSTFFSFCPLEAFQEARTRKTYLPPPKMFQK